MERLTRKGTITTNITIKFFTGQNEAVHYQFRSVTDGDQLFEDYSFLYFDFSITNYKKTNEKVITSSYSNRNACCVM